MSESSSPPPGVSDTSSPPPGGQRPEETKNIATAITEVSERASLLIREEIELAKAEVAEKASKLLRSVGLGGYENKFPWELSGGMQQRASIARALAFDADLLLMDEPFGALDPVTRDALGAAYRDLHERLRLTTIMVTHDVQEAVLLADRIVVMSTGRIRAQGTPAALMANAADPDVMALMAMPKRQAERIAAILERNGGAAAHG